MIYFSSDLHLFHRNIIRLCTRPFKDVDEMHDILIKNFNSSVKVDDQLYLLGDIGLSSKKNIEEVLSKFNGRKYIIVGNHDDVKTLSYLKENGVIEEYYHVYELKVNKQYYWLSHYPHLSWNRSCHGSYHLYGHVHGGMIEKQNGLSIDVGVDCNEFKPLSIDQINDRMRSLYDNERNTVT